MTKINMSSTTSLSGWLLRVIALCAPLPSTAADARLFDIGKQVYEDGNTDSGVPACAGCHKSNGAGNAIFPRLSGLKSPYVLQQLNAFKAGRRSGNRLMITVGQRLTEEEIKAVAEYIAGL